MQYTPIYCLKMCIILIFAEAEGYYFYRYGEDKGIYTYVFDPAQSTNVDKLAFGFMTRNADGTLVHIEGDRTTGDYIEAKLV